MKCPYCGNEMHSGLLRTYREPARWIPSAEEKSRLERFWDSLGGVGGLTAEQRNSWSGGKIPASFCPQCKKMIIETDIVK